MKNEIEICKLINETAVLKRELEQKEKYVEDLSKDIDKRSLNDRDLVSKVSTRVEQKQQTLRAFRQDLREKDLELEFFEFILRDKERNINQMQAQFVE